MTDGTMRGGLRLLWLLLAVGTSGCTKEHGPQTGSTTNWLRTCERDEDCGELQCLCGVCNAPCVRDTSCAEIHADAVCSEAGPQTCMQSDAQSVCALRCDADADCTRGTTCREGYCVDSKSEAMRADASPIDAGGGATLTGAPSGDGGIVDYGFDFVEIAVGGRHACGLRGDGRRGPPGTMVCWGDDSYGAVDRTRTDHLSGIAHIAAGGFHTCALFEDGSLTCWGGGMLDDGQVSGPNTMGTSAIASVSGGDQATCGVRENGSIQCWGNDLYGQVSGANMADMDSAGRDYTQVVVGTYHVCGLHKSGTLTCWGRDLNGAVSGPNAAGLTDIVQIAVGIAHTCVVRATKELQCWGDERLEEVSGPNTARPEFVQVAAGAYQTCGLRDDTSMHCWGNDDDGQVTGMNTRDLAGMVQLGGSIEADGNFLCALSGDGTVDCWGTDSSGQISGLDLLARE